MNYCIICLASSLFIGYFIYNKNKKSNTKFNLKSKNKLEESINDEEELINNKKETINNDKSLINQNIEITNNHKLLEYDNFLLNAIKSINK